MKNQHTAAGLNYLINSQPMYSTALTTWGPADPRIDTDTVTIVAEVDA
jgi:hypothetical protein